MSVVVSVAPEIGLDIGRMYAGGLGVLEGDKFYAASRRGIRYVAVTLYYPGGYVWYRRGDGYIPGDDPQGELEGVLGRVGGSTVSVGGSSVGVEYLRFSYGSSEAVFVRAKSPEWAVRVTEKLYIASSEEERLLKYAILAKAAASYIVDFIGLDKVRYIDLQESYAALTALALDSGRYRIVIHTPAPWAHPRAPCSFLEEEFNFRPEGCSESITLTEVGLMKSMEGIVVSKAMLPLTRKTFPKYAHKIRAVTNAVDIERWIHPKLSRVRGVSDLRKARSEIVGEARRLLGLNVGGRPVIAWARRVTPYKRPEYIEWLASDVGSDAFILISGKAHPHDHAGVEQMERFKRLADSMENVYYNPNLDVDLMRKIIWASDMWSFTPFPAWEASGTSFMKAGINGVPTIASASGATPEIIWDGFNGWLFGSERDDLVDLWSGEGDRIRREEYRMFLAKVREALDSYASDDYWDVAYNAYATFNSFSSMDRLFREYNYY